VSDPVEQSTTPDLAEPIRELSEDLPETRVTCRARYFRRNFFLFCAWLLRSTGVFVTRELRRDAAASEPEPDRAEPSDLAEGVLPIAAMDA
jgi:hypothetical protein